MGETNNDKYFYHFGHKYFGPLLESFCHWLLNDLKNNNIKKVYFLSRDGYIIKKAFDIVNEDLNIKSYYFYASRRSITVPSFYNCKDIYEIFSKLTLPGEITLKSLIKRIGLEDYNLEEYIKKYNLKIDEKYPLKVIRSSKTFNEFFADILPYIKENSIIERRNILQYSVKEDFSGKVAIVDIGWNGTMQMSLHELFEENQIFGYYVALNPNGIYKTEKNNERYKGFICDHNHNYGDYKKLHNFIDIFEFLFLAQHGSVKRFGNEVVEFYKYEYENCVEKEIVSQIQNGALCYLENVIRDLNYNYNSINDKKNINKLFKFFLHPTLNDSKNFGNIKFLNDEFKYIAKPNKIKYYISNKQDLKNDYINSGWRIGFMKNLFKITLPYYHINFLLRKLFNKE